MKSAAIFLSLFLLVAAASAAFTTPATNSGLKISKNPQLQSVPSFPSSKSKSPAVVRASPLRSSSGFFQKSVGIRRFSLRRLLQKVVSIPIKTKLVAFLFAAFFWLQGPLAISSISGPQPAHASMTITNSIERVVPAQDTDDVMLVRSSNSALKLDEGPFHLKSGKSTAANNKAARKSAINGKLATVVAGTVVLGPSGKLVYDYVKEKEKKNEDGNNDKNTPAPKAFKKPSAESASAINVEEKRREERVEQVQKKKVEELLNQAKNAQQSYQQPVVDGSSESSTQSKSVTSSPPIEKPPAVTPQSSNPVSKEMKPSEKSNGVQQKETVKAPVPPSKPTEKSNGVQQDTTAKAPVSPSKPSAKSTGVQHDTTANAPVPPSSPPPKPEPKQVEAKASTTSPVSSPKSENVAPPKAPSPAPEKPTKQPSKFAQIMSPKAPSPTAARPRKQPGKFEQVMIATTD